MSESRGTGDDLERLWTADESPPFAPGRVLLFLFCMALLLGGFWLLSLGVDHGWGYLFVAGIASIALAIGLAVHRPER